MKKFACIFGASGEIGQSISFQMAKEGWSLYLHFHENERAVFDLQKQLSFTYKEQEFFIIQSDLASIQGAERVCDSIFEVQALVFAHGQSLYKLLDDTTAEDMDTLWKTHVQNPLLIVRSLASKLRKHKQSYIVFIGSIWGETGASGETLYSTIKGAQHAFVKAYAKEAGSSGIRVNIVAPGIIETKMNADFDNDEIKNLTQEIPLQRIGQPIEVAHMVQFLTSGNADYVTGQIISVNGGWYI
ncbi:MAG: elongation factor P 5-aminopentanone reductase [Paenisporosarcina sp.]